MSKLKNREEYEGGVKKTEGFEETSNKSPNKEGRISTGGEQFFWLARTYTPAGRPVRFMTMEWIETLKTKLLPLNSISSRGSSIYTCMSNYVVGIIILMGIAIISAF